MCNDILHIDSHGTSKTELRVVSSDMRFSMVQPNSKNIRRGCLLMSLDLLVHAKQPCYDTSTLTNRGWLCFSSGKHKSSFEKVIIPIGMCKTSSLCNHVGFIHALCSLFTQVNTDKGWPRYSTSVLQSFNPIEFMKKLFAPPFFMINFDSVACQVVDEKHMTLYMCTIASIFFKLLIILC